MIRRMYAKFKTLGKIAINDFMHSDVKTIEVIGNQIRINGNWMGTDSIQPISILLEGDVEVLTTTSGDVTVYGDVQSVGSTSGDIEIVGDVGGEVSSTSGDIDITGSVNGSVSSTSGDLTVSNIHR